MNVIKNNAIIILLLYTACIVNNDIIIIIYIVSCMEVCMHEKLFIVARQPTNIICVIIIMIIKL